MVRISECARLTGQCVILSLRNHVGIQGPVFKYSPIMFFFVVFFLDLLVAQDFYSVQFIRELLEILDIFSTSQSVNKYKQLVGT